MSNSVRVSVTFSYRGKLLQPEIRLDLDEALQQNLEPENIYALLATRNGIDYYSYEYEMLQAEPLVFDQAQGLATGFVSEGQLDWAGLAAAWKERQLLDELTRIAREHLGIRELQDLPGLQETLLAAYGAGKSDTAS